MVQVLTIHIYVEVWVCVSRGLRSSWTSRHILLVGCALPTLSVRASSISLTSFDFIVDPSVDNSPLTSFNMDFVADSIDYNLALVVADPDISIYAIQNNIVTVVLDSQSLVHSAQTNIPGCLHSYNCFKLPSRL